MIEICHITTAHRVDDVRVVDKECRTLASVDGYRITIVGAGSPPADVRMRHIPISAPPDRRLIRFATASVRARWATRGRSANVWHFHDLELLPLAIAMARRGQLVVWDAHEDYFEPIDTAAGKQWVPAHLRPAVQRGFGALLKAIDRHAAGVVAATEHIASTYSNPRTVVVGNEARTEAFAACAPGYASRNLLFTGAASHVTCFPEIVEAVAELPEFTLVVAGPQMHPDMEDLAARSLGARFVKLGLLDRAGLASAMTESLIGFVTYEDRATYATNCPNKVFEFAAAGLPVVGTPNPSFTSRVARGEFGVSATDFSASGLSGAILSATADRGRWETLSLNGRAWSASEGSWARSSTALLSFYEELLS